MPASTLRLLADGLAYYAGSGYPSPLAAELIARESGNQPDRLTRPRSQPFWEVGLAQAVVHADGSGDAERWNADPRTVAGGLWILFARAADDAAFLWDALAHVADPSDERATLHTVAALAAYSVGRRGLRDYLRQLPAFVGLRSAFAEAPALGVQDAESVRSRLARVVDWADEYPGGWERDAIRPADVPRYRAADVVAWCRERNSP